MYLNYLRKKLASRDAGRRRVRTLDDVIDFERKRDIGIDGTDFVWLAVGLYRAAGLNAWPVLLPDRRVATFREDFVSTMMLPNMGVAVRFDDAWHFSDPVSLHFLPFGMLAWPSEGQVGLFVRPGGGFVKIPTTPAEESAIKNTGTLHIDEDGMLWGEISRKYTGQMALAFRERFLKAHREDADADAELAEVIAQDFPGATIEGVWVEEDEDEGALEITFQISVPSYAVRADERWIVRPQVCRMQAQSPFSAPVRRSAIQFPFPWAEMDELSIEMPPGFSPDNLDPPSNVRGGEVLAENMSFTFDADTRILGVKRVFACKAVTFPVATYRELKSLFDMIATNDRYEIVFVRSAPDEQPVAPASEESISSP
jgi:hypothetical protein